MPEWSLSVSELNEYVRLKLAGDPMLRSVTVHGEISGFKRHVSGHLYFTLKDEKSRVACAMFRSAASSLDFRPEDGKQVTVTGSAGLYTVSGSYQLYVETMREDGAGDLFLRFERLKSKLADEGLFDPSLKKPLPTRPRVIGVATSITGAAFRDIIRVARARDPRVEILIAPCLVQGAGAAEEIARSVERLDMDGRAEAILVGRGGGSMEDLWAFNEEIVARAIAACRTPVVSCVGHEIDFTIADFVADARAATPSNAAEMAVADVKEMKAGLKHMLLRLQGALNAGQRQRRMRLSAAAKSPYIKNADRYLLEKKRAALENAKNQLLRSHEKRVGILKSRLNAGYRALNAMDPQKVLARGYACVRVDGHVASDALSIREGQEIRVEMRDAALKAKVESVLKQKNARESVSERNCHGKKTDV